MNKETFITERTRIISEMLDNPNKYDIYPTTKCCGALDDLFDRITKERLLGADALFGFGAWLATKKKIVLFSYKHEVAEMVELLKEFIVENNLPDVSEGYPNTFKMPK